MAVFAAGAVLWRIENSKLKVAVIHRGRYDDWSWPKGKVDPGEVLPEAAVREIKEETGLKVVLGLPLGIQRYRLPNKKWKEVHYWAAKVTEKALATSKFVPNEEVSAVHWLTPAQAQVKLTYSHDLEQLNLLLEYFDKQLLETKPLLLLRHGKARSRATWKDTEASRPLLSDGNAQAEALPKLLKAFGAKLVYSSPWTRCLSTIAPYAQSTKVKVKTSPEFTEDATVKKPEQTKALLRSLITLDKSLVICTHRPVFPVMLEELSKRAKGKVKERLEAVASLKPGSVAVIHLSRNEELKRIVDVEYHSPLIAKKK